ncbi:MAG: S8 family serine peptidase [Acidobacteria bacterium]|nr:S8 family serine peptidase [Acidobacteriota bacterium]
MYTLNTGTLRRGFSVVVLFCIVTACSLFAAPASVRYILILNDPPVSEYIGYRTQAKSPEAEQHRLKIQRAQQTLRRELESRHIRVVGSSDYLVNALYLQAAPDRVPELRSLPGVKAVIPSKRYKRKLNRAVPLVNGPAAWNTLGGAQNAGLGTKIAILDTGIDQTHPAFKDSSLPMPAGFPICQPQDCAFTNNKVIVARSYVAQLAAGSAPNPAADSRPDDYSPRDRIGHGTATGSIAAGVTAAGPAAAITGIAPKAYLGNYKIFGSPGLNGFSSDDVIVKALEDALKDGMDVASLALGAPALTGPLDSGDACGNPADVPCDIVAVAVENASKNGMVVVSAAGNAAESGVRNIPTRNTIDSPANAPSAIAAGASTNSHTFVHSVRVPGNDAPPGLRQIPARFGDGPLPNAPVTAPLRDVALLENDGFACSALPSGALDGVIGLIARGNCSFAQKVANAQNAGAVGVIIYNNEAGPLFGPGGLSGASIPTVLISQSDGEALKNFSNANPDHAATLDPGLAEQTVSDANQLAPFSSLGPSTSDALIKPDLVAVGTAMYMAAQKYDPLGAMYSPDGFTVADGTSFSTPLVAGAAALVKQKNPRFSAAQIKSALVNTATPDVITETGAPGRVNEVGGGKLDANGAVAATVTAQPATLSFGVITSPTALPINKQIQITNSGASAVNLTISVAETIPNMATTITTAPQTLALNPGASGTVTVTLAGSTPTPGSYDGNITFRGGTVALHVPIAYFARTGTPANLIPLLGEFFDGTVNEETPEGALAFKLVDSVGLPIAGAPVSFLVRRGGGTIAEADQSTDKNGIAAAVPVLGPDPGLQSFIAAVGGLTITFSGFARPKPAIAEGGIVDGASFEPGKPAAPGSYISLFGAGLSDTRDQVRSLPLPLAIDFVSVSFDAPGLSLPGRLLFVSPGQVNVQVPWELQGQSSVQVKVTIDFSRSNVYTLPLALAAPSFFESTDTEGNRIIAALDESNNLIGSSNPAVRGRVVQLFANGLGPVTNQPATGEPAPFSPLAVTTTVPTVTIGGVQATVSYSGLAPGFPALYQLNVTVPDEVAPGLQPVVISMGGTNSKLSNLAVQ